MFGSLLAYFRAEDPMRPIPFALPSRGPAILVALVVACSGPLRGPADKAPATAAAPVCPPADLPPPRVWRLTHSQLRNTLLDVFGFTGPAVDALPADSRLDGFANGADRLGVPPLLLEYYDKTADEVSTDVVRRSNEFLSCPLAALGTGDCLDRFLRTVALRAWRRPLDAAERARLLRVYEAGAAAGGPPVGFKMLVEAVIVSPNFLFRHELGDTRAPGAITRLTDWELAAALSYSLWDAPPDATLLEEAAAGRLRDPATLGAQATRLLGTPGRSSAALNAFLRQWLRIDGLLGAGKDPKLYPAYDGKVARDLLEETRLTFDSVVFDSTGDRRLDTLLSARYGFVNGKTGKIYGLTRKGGELKRTDLDPAERRGLFTQAAFLAAHADADVTRPVDRGKFVREEVLCQDVPPPPDEFKFDPSKITDDMTGREKLTAHAKNPFCARCHALFDGIGFALESYDAVGQWRDTDKGKPIDPTGKLPFPDGSELHFRNFVDLVDQLTTRPEPYACFAGRYLAYATGRRLDQIPACEQHAVLAAFNQSGHRIDTLVMAVIGTPGFVTRRNPGASP
jgi:Protein of unknown function (DUF1592)/Protein of unknown function (DUF1588)/Protein of unknown function (DUF1595)/Protein of unknown function (DUF1587)/Protein of unknown function (DUF1585)